VTSNNQSIKEKKEKILRKMSTTIEEDRKRKPRADTEILASVNTLISMQKEKIIFLTKFFRKEKESSSTEKKKSRQNRGGKTITIGS